MAEFRIPNRPSRPDVRQPAVLDEGLRRIAETDVGQAGFVTAEGRAAEQDNPVGPRSSDVYSPLGGGVYSAQGVLPGSAVGSAWS
jgi:hypothetical protein